MRRLMGAVLVGVLVVACTGEEAAEEEVVIPTPSAPTIADRQSDEDAVEEDEGGEAGEDPDAEGSAAQDEDAAEDEAPEDGGEAGEDGDEDGWRPMTPEEAEAWRAPGSAGEVFAPAAQQAEITNAAHSRWFERFRPAGRDFMPEWQWANKEELWDEIVEAVWSDATERYGTRLRDRPGTVWPGADSSANAVAIWSDHTAGSGRHGWIGNVRVGIEPEDPEQARPDVGLYVVQVQVLTTEDPNRFEGRLHHVHGPIEFSGELTWPDEVMEAFASVPGPEGGWQEVGTELSAEDGE